MHDMPMAPQALLNESGAHRPPGADDLARVQARAHQLLDELNAFDGESRRGSHLTFLLCSWAVGLLALAAGLYAWLDQASGPHRLQWHWLPMMGGVCVLGLAVFSMVQGRAGLRAPRVVAGLILFLFIAALRLNGAAPLVFMTAVVIFLHMVVPTREALLASLVVLTAAVLVPLAPDPHMQSIFLPRALAASAFALLVMQLLVRRNLSFKRMTRRVSRGLGDVVQALTSDLSAARAARDVAERALAAQRAADARLETYTRLTTEALQCMSQGLAVIDSEGRVQLYNERHCQLLDLPAELMSTKPLLAEVVAIQARRGDFGPDHELVQPNARSYVTSLGLDPHMPEPPKYLRKTRGGRFLEIASQRTASGYLVRTYTDVTEHVQANQKLEESLEQLRMADLQLKAELGRSREAMDLQARFVASVSHEIRTPLNGIAGMAELLAHAPLAPEQRSQLDDLRASTRQLRRLTDDILDLARVRSPRFALDSRTFNVWQQVRSCAAAAQAVARRKHLRVDLELAGPDCAAVGDPERIAQILNNLLFNAVKFTRRGFVRVMGSWELSAADPDRVEVRISVADSGRGIEPALIAVIFEPFHQGDESINRNFGGTGLGLTLCRELCEAMDGQIQVASRPNHGSVFSFNVSLHRAAGVQEEMPTQPAEWAEAACFLEGVRILAVDDNRINQKLLQTWLGQAGAEVVLACNGEEGVRLAASQTFDCVLMDMSMPVMNGLQATQAIRCLDKSANAELVVRAWVPIVGVTAMARKEDRQLCLDAGMNAHLAKPFDRLELLRTVRRLADYAAWLQTAGDFHSSPDQLGGPAPQASA